MTSLPLSSEAPGGPVDSTAKPSRTYLGWSVAATALCFLPLGIIALVFGLRTSRAVAEGRTDDARRASRVARRWLVATVIVGIVVYVFLAAVLALLGAYSQ